MSPETHNRRRRPRISTMILCEIRVGEQPPELVRVRDLNECGMKIATPKVLLLGDRLRVRLPGASDWSLARVVWCARGVAGLAFARAVDLPMVVGARATERLGWSRASQPARLAG